MTAPVQQHEIRAALRSRLQQLSRNQHATAADGPTDQQAWLGGEQIELQETLLIRDGCYCGQRFMAGEYSAVWFIEEGEIKIYGPNGKLVEAYRTQSPPNRRAAA